MFSANENLVLRQHKKRIVEQIESMIPEDALDLGTTVMVMEVKCNTPGCVPIETAIIIVFPQSTTELIPGLPESKSPEGSKTGGNYKTKILKPMKDVTIDDIKESLPPSFAGGLRTMEKLCINARDIMISQITQLFGPTSSTAASSTSGNLGGLGGAFQQQQQQQAEVDEDPAIVADRKLMAQYLQNCLQEYIDHNCIPPEWGQPYNSDNDNKNNTDPAATSEADQIPSSLASPPEGNSNSNSTTTAPTTSTSSPPPMTEVVKEGKPVPSAGNFVVKRKNFDESGGISSMENKIRTGTASIGLRTVTTSASTSSSSTFNTPTIGGGTTTTVLSSVRATQTRQAANNAVASAMTTANNGVGGGNISQLFNREHAPGIRQPGCPCCDPDNPNNVLDKMMSMM